MEIQEQNNRLYCPSLTSYQRRKTIEVNIGDVPMGADHPIRIQSMTTIDTMDTRGSVEQTLRMVESGCDYVRITAPSIREAQNLEEIRKELHRRGCHVPLIADIHFTPNAAELAARIVEKVRINPGNYADKKRFEQLEYTNDSYRAELDRIREKFIPLIRLCKEYGTAMRIGTNHGSLSDRIMSRYGDTPLGMVESALEFLRICEDLNYYNIVLSMKASNTQVMVQAYRLLVHKLEEEGLKPYPLHLGVTEAGEGEDGRIKSAVGIGTLLEDGLGDTVRVSLTEEPEYEAPVARALVERYALRTSETTIEPLFQIPKDPYSYARRESRENLNIGSHNVPRVVADLSRKARLAIGDLKAIGHFYLPEPDKWRMNDTGADYLYTGDHPVAFMLPNGLKQILNYTVWKTVEDRKNNVPCLTPIQYVAEQDRHPELNFLRVRTDEFSEALYEALHRDHKTVLWVYTDDQHAMPSLRRIFFELMLRGLDHPVIIERSYPEMPDDQLQLYASTDIGGLLIDGLGDGAVLSHRQRDQQEGEDFLETVRAFNQTTFGILQAARTRMTKTEYISCPSCGRTLFDLQETTAMIRKRTDHLKGIKIGIMGCIVNGPGEMADADYGYVGSGKGKITLYKGQEVVKRGVPSAEAVDELIEIIRQDGNWNEPDLG